MPLRSDISRVLVLGSGPTVVGQGAEFDYAGTQACLSLREAGVSVVVLNDNHASYMTTGACSDAVVIASVTRESAVAAMREHGCDAVLASCGGQTALNVGAELVDRGDVAPDRVLGTPRAGVDIAENRRAFAAAAASVGAPCARHADVSPDTCEDAVRAVGLPCIVRASYTLGGSGTRLCRSAAEVREFVRECFERDSRAECVAEADLSGWVEVEFEIVRDSHGSAVAVCGMENVDSVGIHTGDSVVVAPIQTLDDELVQELRAAALRVAGAVGVVGACNVQLAARPETREWKTIECNPRTSRSSALASKATGYPIARVAALLAAGMSLSEVTLRSTSVSAALEPAMDYVVVKVPAWSDDKFPALTDAELGSSMRATGESMGLGATFAEAYFKALRGVGGVAAAGTDCSKPTASRPSAVIRALLSGVGAARVSSECGWRAWFTSELSEACDAAAEWRDSRGASCEALERAKRSGVPDALLAELAEISESAVRAARRAVGITPNYRAIDGTAAERAAITKYCYSTYSGGDASPFTAERVALVVGSGPITIGQGIEFDCCAVEAVTAARELGWSTAVINCNPETVSTDYDVSDTLVFDPVDAESLDDACCALPLCSSVLAQFGGQRALSAVISSDTASVIAASQVSTAIIAGDRAAFDALVRRCGLSRPKSWAASDPSVKLPAIIRPSHVIGGAGMSVAASQSELREALAAAKRAGAEPVTADEMLSGVEFDVDVVRDERGIALLPGAVEQIDPPGVHSGDSRCFWPASALSRVAEDAALKITAAADLVGVANVQVIVSGGLAWPIELNARASRTVPFVERASGARVIRAAVRALLAGSAGELESQRSVRAWKRPVFSPRLPRPTLGPVMQSTGESMTR